MNAKSKNQIILLVTLIAALLLSACSPKATEAPAMQVKPEAKEPAAEAPAVKTLEVEKVVKETVIKEVKVEKEVEKVVVATAAPQPTQAPLAAAQPAIQPTQAPLAAHPASAAPTPIGNEFAGYGVNPYVDTLEDHLSTFSLDVDTASYTVMRRYLKDGNLPPAEAVRVEEFVNYFDGGYPTPPDVAFGIYADGAPSPFDSYNHAYIVRFGVQGYQVAEWERKPVALTFVIDISGSMAMENRLELVKNSLNLLVQRLRPEDSVAIVVYGSEARMWLEPTNGRNRDMITTMIYSLSTEGATNAEAGLRLGYQTAMRSFNPRGVNRVILCSDGVANVGETDPEAILSEVRGYVEEGIYLTTVGFGMGNFNDVLMEQLADNGNGSYAYVDDLDEAQRLFVDKLTSTLEVIALDAKVQVDFNADTVSYYRLIGYENRAVADQDFRNNTVDAGEIGAGHSATALYAVILKPGAEGRLATVQLRWEDPQTHQVKEINGNFNTWDLVNSFGKASPRYQLAVIVAQYAELLRNSPWARGSDLAGVYEMAAGLRYSLADDPDVIELIDLIRQAAQISR